MHLTEVEIIAGICLGCSLCIGLYAYKRICSGNNKKDKKLNFETDGFEMKDMEVTSFVYSDNWTDKLEEPVGTGWNWCCGTGTVGTGAKPEMPIRDLTQILEVFAAHQEKTKYLEEKIKSQEKKIVGLVKATKELGKIS